MKISQGIDEHGKMREPKHDEIIHIPSVLVRDHSYPQCACERIAGFTLRKRQTT